MVKGYVIVLFKVCIGSLRLGVYVGKVVGFNSWWLPIPLTKLVEWVQASCF